MNNNIIFIGFMGVGKTSVGKALAKKLNYNFIDTDDEIQKKSNLTIQNIFDKYGEKYFRKLENDVIEDLSICNNSIISTGGGSVLDRKNVEIFKKIGKIIYLEASAKKVYENLKYNNINRPLLKKISFEEIKKTMMKREEYYLCYDFKINVDNKSIEQVIDILIKMIRGEEYEG